MEIFSLSIWRRMDLFVYCDMFDMREDLLTFLSYLKCFFKKGGCMKTHIFMEACVQSCCWCVLFILLIGCVSGKKMQKTSFYQLQGMDTICVAQRSWQADSTRILVVKMSENGSELTSDVNFMARQGNMDATFSDGGWLDESSGASMKHEEVSGKVSNQWLNNLVLSRIFMQLTSLPVDRVKLLNPAQGTVSRNRLEEVLTLYDVNLVVSVDSIVLQVNQENTHAVQQFGRLSSTYSSGGTTYYRSSPSYSSDSHQTDVNYCLYFTLFEVNPPHQVMEEKHLVQVGMYRDSERGAPMQMVVRSALKAGDDFTLLFKPGDNR